MSLLHQETPDEVDDAALGEEFTKGSSHLVWATIAATVLVTIAIAIYCDCRPKAACGHGRNCCGVGTSAAHGDLRTRRQRRSHGQRTALTRCWCLLKSGCTTRARLPLVPAECADECRRWTMAFTPAMRLRSRITIACFSPIPDMPVPHGPGLPLNLTLDPGQSVDGTFVSSFRLTRQQWDARKKLNFSFLIPLSAQPRAHAPDRRY